MKKTSITAQLVNAPDIEVDDIPFETLAKYSKQFVDASTEEAATLHKIYPKHLYDKQRRKMAVELAGKEIAKIVNANDNKELEKIRHAVEDLYEGRAGVYAPVHDFWSFVEMVLHVKKKELPELITAQNVSWKQENLPLEELSITSMPFLEQQQDVFGPKPWKIAELQRIFFQKPELFEQAKEDQRQNIGKQQHHFDQSEEPITILYRNDGLELIDGNGRLYRALLEGRDTISCYVGRLEGVMPMNYWVSAGAIKQFCLEVRGYAEVDLEGFANGLSYLRTKLRNNTPALINYELFLRNDFPEFEDTLRGVVPTKAQG
jgi:hypothetical protein